jgi:hypothetical protein
MAEVTGRPDPDEFSRDLAQESLRGGSPTDWFERLYVAAGDGEVDVPWDRGEAHPLLVEWLDARPSPAGSAVVVGFGRGYDAELLAARGSAVTAFEISPTAVSQARAAYPSTGVDYLVVEIMTVQAMPRGVCAEAIAGIRSLVAPGGTLVGIGGVGTGEPVDGPPWPLDRVEMESFGSDGLRLVRLETLDSPVVAGAQRWRGEWQRPLIG